MGVSLARATLGAALFALFAWCARPALGGQTPDAAPSASPSPLPEIGHVSTSDRQDEPIGATTRSTYVITKADLIAHGDLSVAAALERVPGVSVAQYGAFGSLSSVTIRGSSSKQVLTLLDGRPVSGAQTAGVDLGAVPTAGVERIEVVEGGGSTLYGTGAIGGVINIITARSGAGDRIPLVTLRDASFGERSIAIETKNFSFERLVAANGYGYPAFAADPAGSRVNSDLSSTTARAVTSTTLGALHATGSTGLRERHLGIPGELDFGTAYGARQNTVDADVHAALSFVRGHATTTLDVSGERETLDSYDFDGRDAATAGAPFLDVSVESNLALSLRNVVAVDANRLVYGVDLARGVARNDANGTFVATPFAQTALYAQDSLQFGAGTRVSAGLRGERDGALGGALTPSLGVAQNVGKGVVLKANLETAFRVPTQEDLFYPGFANPTLRPEHSNGYDVSLLSSRVLGGASFSYFTNFGIDQIVLNPNANFSLPFGPANEPLINAKRTSVAGFTVQIATRPFHNIVTTFNLTDTYRALDLSAAATRLSYVPVLTSNLELAYAATATRAPFAGFGIIAHTVGQRFPTSGVAATYTRIDAYVRYRAFEHAILTLRALNLGDERYTDVAHYPMPGRSIGIELSTR